MVFFREIHVKHLTSRSRYSPSLIISYSPRRSTPIRSRNACEEILPRTYDRLDSHHIRIMGDVSKNDLRAPETRERKSVKFKKLPIPFNVPVINYPLSLNVPIVAIAIILATAICIVIYISTKYSKHKKATRRHGMTMMSRAVPATMGCEFKTWRKNNAQDNTSAMTSTAEIANPANSITNDAHDPIQVYDFWFDRFSATSLGAVQTFHALLQRHDR